MPEPRRLPVLQSPKPAPPASSTPSTSSAAGGSGGDDEPEPRPAWHWSLIGAVLIFSMMLPLSLVAFWISNSLMSGMIPATEPTQVQEFMAQADRATLLRIRVYQFVPAVIAFLLAAMAGGALVGRFGGDARTKEATVAGLTAATIAWLLTALSGGMALIGVLLVVWPPLAALGSLGGYLGGRWGVGKRG